MKTQMLLASAAMVTSLFAPACLQGEEDDSDWSLPNGTFLSPQGVFQQGNSMQGQALQGNSMQGNSMQGDNLNGVGLQSFATSAGVPITGVSLTETSFSGTLQGATISGDGFIGARMLAYRRDGSTLTLRIDDIEPSADPEILHYFVSYDAGSAWMPLCRNEAGDPSTAIPVAGRWDYSTGTLTGGSYISDSTAFTLGCSAGVIHKCVEFGYKPWEAIEECHSGQCHVVSKLHLLQACTRMMRADYCGNGTPHTVNGTTVNLFDNFGIQDDESVTLTLEAEWTINGASCVKHARWGQGGQTVIDGALADIALNCPEVQEPAAQDACGTSSSTFTTSAGFSTPIGDRPLIRNESEAPPQN